MQVFKREVNIKLFISYIGILPFFITLLDLIFLNFFPFHLLKDFIFFYTLIIFTFIGAMRWNFDKNTNKMVIFYGFSPSLISTFLIFSYLLEVNINLILLLTSLCIAIQLYGDFIICNKNYAEKFFFLRIRLPISIIIVFIINYIIFV